MTRVKDDYRNLTGTQKAACFMLSIGSQNAAVIFEKMDNEEVRELSNAMSNLGNISAGGGFSVDSADKDACVQSMKNLLSQSDSFAKLGQNGKNYATENFSKEVCVSQLESML